MAKGIFGSVVEGGQTAAHRIRMALQVLNHAILVFVVCFVFLFSYKNYRSYRNDPYIFWAWWYQLKETSLLTKGEPRVLVDDWFVQYIDGYIPKKENSHKKHSLNRELFLQRCNGYNQVALQIIKHHATSSFRFGLFGLFVVLTYFFLRGRRSSRKKVISGGKLISAKRLAYRLLLTRKASDIRLGSLPLLKGSENRHIMVTGGTGSGKTNCFNHILPTIRKRLEKAIVVDSDGTLVTRYFREGKDTMLNPYDLRSVLWLPWADCNNSADYKDLCEGFFPKKEYGDPFWVDSARELLYALLRKEEQTQDIEKVLGVYFQKAMAVKLLFTTSIITRSLSLLGCNCSVIFLASRNRSLM